MAAPENLDAEYQEIPKVSSTSQVHQIGVCHSAAAILGIDINALNQLEREALNELVCDFAEVSPQGNGTWAIPTESTTRPIQEMLSLFDKPQINFPSTTSSRLQGC